MTQKMNSRERMLAALRLQEVDYVPCCPFFSPSLKGPQYSWVGRTDTIERIVNGLGLDTIVTTGLNPSVHPDISMHLWTENKPGARWPILHKQIDTPKGALTAAIWITDDLEHKEDIPLNSDYNVSRFVKPWLETIEDVERYAYVNMPPDAHAIAEFEERFTKQKKLAQQYNVATHVDCGLGLTGALQLFGAQQAVLISMDHPEVLQRYLEIEHQSTMKRAEVLADAGVDIIRRNGFYETTDFWNPRQIQQMLVPLLREEIEVMRSNGAVVDYTVETGVMPLLDILNDLEFNGYFGIEPALGHQDMQQVAKKLSGHHAIWGGVSGPIHIGEGSPEEVRQAVSGAFTTFGKRGFVLSAVPSIRAHWPWENTLAMIDQWRLLR